MIRFFSRLFCRLTLGHDLDYDKERRVNIEGWWAYPCRKCGQLIFPSVFAGVDTQVEIDKERNT